MKETKSREREERERMKRKYWLKPYSIATFKEKACICVHVHVCEYPIEGRERTLPKKTDRKRERNNG